MAARAALFGLLLAAACARETGPGATRSAIVAGTVNDGDPAVVALMGPDLCTGTLIASRAVITAAHCDRPTSVFFGTDLDAGGASVRVVEQLVHPLWNPETLELDVALLLLGDDAPVAAVHLNDLPLGEAQLGLPVRLVGFGETGPGNGERGVKRQAASRLRELEAFHLEYGGTEGQTCFGDSGGPVFMDLDGEERLAGVTSNGDASCAVFGSGPRIDAILNDFIRPFLAAHPDCRADGACRPECAGADPDCGAPGTLTTGQACQAHADCVSGLCIGAVDDPARRYCTEPCSPGSIGCPTVLGAPMTCTPTEDPALSVCAWPAPSPGAVGWPCADESVCPDGLCVPSDEGGRICSRPCQSAGTAGCPLGYACAEDPLGGGARYCLPQGAAGGCEAAPCPGRASAALAFVLACVLGLRRRPRVL